MSKTYRKVASFTDYSRSYTKWSKRQASKAVRRSLDLDSGKRYRMVYNPYNIHDYRSSYYTAEEAQTYTKARYVIKESSPWAYRTYETIRKMT